MALIVESLQKSYGSVKALRGVDLEVSEGEIVALLGPNGAGKTTLVSIVAGLHPPDSGGVWVQGIDVLRQPEKARRHLGIAPQQTGVYPVLSVYENLYFFGALGGLGKAELNQRIEESSEAFELLPLLDRQARFLSGGEARRLHTAMALMHDPALLLLDEPTAGVDVRTRSRLLEVVRGLAERGSAVCYSTHYLGEVEELNASVAILDHGRIIARDSLPGLLRGFGQAAIEMKFDTAPPQLPLPGAVTSGACLRIPTERPPAEQAGEVLAALGAAARTVRSIEFVEPNLESVFLALTGRKFAGDDADGAGDAPS
jgi:ABC-2 type transport system ATP-binding protein